MTSNASSSATTVSADSLYLRIFSHFLSPHITRHAIRGAAFRQGVAIGCCTVSSIIIRGVSEYPLVVVYLVLVLGLPIEGFEHRPRLLQSHFTHTLLRHRLFRGCLLLIAGIQGLHFVELALLACLLLATLSTGEPFLVSDDALCPNCPSLLVL